MKSKKIKTLEKILKFMAVTVLKRREPVVVAVTGSVGKTTTKEAIGQMLEKFISVRKSSKNFNNEIGVPLTIIGANIERVNFPALVTIFFKWLGLLLLPVKYPKALVLEMAADRPGDIEYLCNFVPVSVGVLTDIGLSHLEYFKTQKMIAKEKGTLLRKLPSNGLGVYNFDNQQCREIGEKINANNISYGFEEGAQIRATDLVFVYQEVENSQHLAQKILSGVSFKLNYQGKIIPVRLNGCISRPMVYAVLAAFCVGEYFNLNLVEMAQALQDFVSPPGRMNLLKGIKRSLIIDDTYNSSPASVAAALEVVERLQAKRKIIVLGDMLELGNEEESGHRSVGEKIAQMGADYFIAVGSRMKWAAEEFSKRVGQTDKLAVINSPMAAGRHLQEIIQEGDLVLIKGSQGMRMEMVTEEVMSEPQEKQELLARQDIYWKNKPFSQP